MRNSSILQKAESGNSPNLLYAGDVAVQSFCHGSSLIYRLLAEHPAEKLLIVETSWIASDPSRRLPGVKYLHHRPWWKRAFFSPRLERLAPWFAWLSERTWRGIAAAAGHSSIHTLVTVAHGYNWLGASAWAQHLKIPLKLIVHDDWPRQRRLSSVASRQLDVVFARHYRGAASRLCVSAYMEDFYQKRYGVGGETLYPSRDASIAAATSPQSQVFTQPDCLRVAFAGTLQPGYEQLLRAMVRVVGTMGGQLLMFGPFGMEDLKSVGLSGPAVEWRGLLEAGALQQTLRREADALYVPMSFEERDRANTEVSFPSKLADYTACGLPVLIHAPPWSSAVRWARENPESALLVDSSEDEALRIALNDLRSNFVLRESLAQGAIAAGSRYFSAEAAAARFKDCILAG